MTRIPDSLAAAVDDLVRAGAYESRSDAVRAGLGAVVDHQRRAAVGKAISDGYRRIPQTQEELIWPDSASAAMIADEPW